MAETIKIINGKVLTSYRLLEEAVLLIKEGEITYIGNSELVESVDAEIIDARGQYVSPGFIDIHVHGGGGQDFMDGCTECFLQAAERQARYAMTAMNPTTLTREREGSLKTVQID